MALEEAKMPTTQPRINTANVNISFCSNAFRIYSYFPITNNRKLPDIPGKIMAQIAITPEPKIIHRLLSDDPGGRPVIQYAIATPSGRAIIASTFQRLTSRRISSALIRIRPQKKDHTGMG